MCKYKNCKISKTLSCSSDEELPIDSFGYCLFHSKDDKWKIQNNFSKVFFVLIQKITEKYRDIETYKWSYNFEGFNFPENLDIELNEFNFRAQLKFIECNFKSELKFTQCYITSITVNNSIFQKNITFKQTNIKNGIYSESVIYDGSFRILNSSLAGYSYFKKNKFRANSSQTEFLIKECDIIEYISFEDCSFDKLTAVVKSTLNKEIQFVNCLIKNEFLIDDSVINDSLSFNTTYFTAKQNFNPIFSSTQFENITLAKTGVIKFKGEKEREDVVLNELSISFKNSPLGLIVFENFNLNKIFHKTKKRLFTLEKQGIVEIGDGCRKYHCQTDILTVKSNNATQELILSLTKMFCKYFEFSEHKSMGVEIVERTSSLIRFFYFTDDKISPQEFADRLKSNEYEMWHTFSKLTTYNTSKVEDLDIQFLLADISSFFLKLGTLVNHKSSNELDVQNILNSISGELESNEKIVQGKSILDVQELRAAIKEQSNNFFKKNNDYVQIKNIEEVNITNNFYEPVEKVINTENFFEGNKSSEEQKIKISDELNKIKSEPDKEKKASKLKKFIQEWGGTITDLGMTMIKRVIE